MWEVTRVLDRVEKEMHGQGEERGLHLICGKKELVKFTLFF